MYIYIMASEKTISVNSMRVLNTDVVGRKNKSTLRKYFKTNYDLKTFNDLLAFVIAFGYDVGKRKKTQEKRTFQFLAEIYNDDVIQKQKIQKEIKKQTKKAEAKKQIGKYINIVIEFKGFSLKMKNKTQEKIETFRKNNNPIFKNRGGKFTEEEVKQIRKDNSINAVEGEIERKIKVNGKTEIETLSNTLPDITEIGKAQMINISGYKLENVVSNEYYLHSKKPIVNINEWINEKLDKVLVYGYDQSPYDWCSVKLIKKNILAIKRPKNPRSLPIKQAGALNLDHHTLKNEDWDKKRDMCVVDYILWKYGVRDGFKKKLKTIKGTQQEKDEAVQFYSTHFIDMANNWERNAGVYDNPNEEGYTIDHIEQFCENFEINMICLIDGEIKYHYYTSGNGAKKHPAFVFEMKNNHLYPICDTKTIERYTRQIKNIKSNTLQMGKKDETKDDKEEIKINVFKDTSIKHNTNIEYAIEMMERQNTQTNYPTNLKLNNNILSNFELNGKRYLFTDENNELTQNIMKYCEDNGVEFVGQSPQSFTHDNLIEFNKVYSSYLNNDVREALCCQQVKDRTHRGICVDRDEFFECYDDAECFDMNKQYRYAMENPLENFMTIDFTDTIEDIDINNSPTHVKMYGSENSPTHVNNDYRLNSPTCTHKKIELGLYYVITNDKTLFFGNNFYSSATIKEAINLGIEFECKYFIRGTPITDTEIFKDIIEEMKKKYSEYPVLMKQIINSIYGMMAKTKNKNATLKVDTDINRVYEKYAVENGKINKKIYVEKVITESGKEYFVYGDKTERKMMNHNLPIAIQIQDFANIYFNRMITSIGGKLLWRKTDCAMIYKPQNINVSNEIGGYDYHTKPVMESLKMDIDRHYDYIKPDYEWNMMEENDSDDWVKIIENVKNNGGGMVCGRAGTGKSFVSINGMKYLQENYEIKSQPLAFTNKATIQLNGKTIDSFLRIDKDNKVNKKWAIETARGISMIIIDEISMIGKHRWKLLSEFKMLTGIPFMLCGDDRQLPPVETDNGAGLVQNECNDADILDEMKDSVLTIDDLITGTNITYLNKTRQKINSIVQNYIKPDDALFIPYELPKNKDGKEIQDGLKYHQDAYIFIGAKLIMWITPKSKTFKKNECVEVIDYDDENIVVSNGVDEMEFNVEDFHKTFLLGYASTTHKSQGDTCDGVVNIFDTDFMINCLSNDDGDNWFNHPVIYSLCNGAKCELTEMKRYDRKLWNKLEDICESDIGGRKAIYTAISRARKFSNVKIRNLNDYGNIEGFDYNDSVDGEVLDAVNNNIDISLYKVVLNA